MEKIQAHIILEVLGKPKEHVKAALQGLVSRLESEKGIKVIEKTLHDPIEVETSKDLFTTFAEITLEIHSFDTYFGLLFAYMPAHIEFIHPEKIGLTNVEFNDLSNKLIQRLHDYDAITKKALYENQILTAKLKEVAPHLFSEEKKDSGKK